MKKQNNINIGSILLIFLTGLGLGVFLLGLIDEFLPKETNSYYVGFQDGQANCTRINDYHYDLKCYIPLENGNYSVDNEGIIHTPSGRNIKCEEMKK